MTVEIDRDHHLTTDDLAAVRGPYVRRPAADAAPAEWVPWACEIDGASGLARSIVEAAKAKAAAAGKGGRK